MALIRDLDPAPTLTGAQQRILDHLATPGSLARTAHDLGMSTDVVAECLDAIRERLEGDRTTHADPRTPRTSPQRTPAARPASHPRPSVPDLPATARRLPLTALDLSPRAYNALRRVGIDTVAAAHHATAIGSLTTIRGLGVTTIHEIQAALHRLHHDVNPDHDQQTHSTDASLKTLNLSQATTTALQAAGIASVRHPTRLAEDGTLVHIPALTVTTELEIHAALRKHLGPDWPGPRINTTPDPAAERQAIAERRHRDQPPGVSPAFTSYELRVLHLLDLTPPQIAVATNSPMAAVSDAVDRILSQCNARSPTEAALRAASWGLLRPA